MRALARNHDFTLLWVGQALSKLGSRGTALALPLLILQITGNPAAAGVAAFVDQAADLLVTLPGGAIADRVDRRTVMVACDLLGCLGLCALVFVVTSGVGSFPVIIAAALLDSVAASVYGSAAAAALPSVVSSEELPEAISLVQARNSAVYLVGPILGGVLFAVAPWLPFVVDAVSYAVSALLAAAVRTRLSVEVAPERTFRGDLVAGARFIARAPALRLALVNASVLNSAFGGIVLAVIALSTVDGAPAPVVGVVVAMSSVGSIIGALLAPAISRRWGMRRTLLTLLAVFATAVPAMALRPEPQVLGPLLATCALLAPALNTVVFTVITGQTPNEMQGRVQSAVAFCAIALAPLGPLVAGALLATAGATVTFLAFGAVLAALAVWTAARRQVLHAALMGVAASTDDGAAPTRRAGRHRSTGRPRPGRHRMATPRPRPAGIAARVASAIRPVRRTPSTRHTVSSLSRP
ncbi:MAG: MFS transporter [Dermatophilaceae bacterium]